MDKDKILAVYEAADHFEKTKLTELARQYLRENMGRDVGRFNNKMGRKVIKPIHPDLLAELRTLSDDVPDACTPSEIWAYVRPIRRIGHEHLPKSFWALLCDYLVWRKDMTDEVAQRLARWIKLRRENAQSKGRDWPPAPVTRPYFGQPAPWDGKHEKGVYK